jgi:hypothetical protein
MSCNESHSEVHQETQPIVTNSTTTPPPSRTTSDASDTSDTSDTLTEYHATSVESESDSDSDKEVKKILESETFQWKELDTFHPVPSLTQEEKDHRPIGWDSPEDEEDEMPPLVSDSEDQESESEDQESESEDQEVSDAESDVYYLPPTHQECQEPQSRQLRPSRHQRPSRQQEVPPLIYLLGFLFFVLHMIHFITLLKDKQERAHSPCFPFKY